MHNRIGTSRIESIAKQVEGNDTRNPTTVCYIVKKQLNGLVKEINTLKARIFQNDKDIRKKLGSQWRICLYTSACDVETSFTWHKEKKHSVRSRKHLFNKYKNSKNISTVEHGGMEIHISEDLTTVQREEFMSNQDQPVSLGVDLTPHELAFLKLPQNLTDHTNFDYLKACTDTALMASKYRMSVSQRIKQGRTEEDMNLRPEYMKREEAIEEVNKTKVYDFDSKYASFSNMRVTSMKTCRRVTIPEPLPEQEEAHIQTVITAVEGAINREAARNKSMRIKPSTLTKSEALGLKTLKKRTKEG